MLKDEFVEYLKYLKKLFPKAEIPLTDKEIMAAWYKPFKNTDLIIAKDMADKYLLDETYRFNFAKLLQYKTEAMAGKTDNKYCNVEKCNICNSKGFLEYRKTETSQPYFYRCTCSNGHNFKAYPLVTSRIEESIMASKSK